MHLPTLTALYLPLLASAQFPILDQAKSLFSSLTGTGSSLSSAARPVTSAISHAGVTDLTLENWKETFSHSGSAAKAGGAAPDVWMLYVTGGNKSCGGHCGRMDAAWDEAATSLLATPSDTPHLARLDCETQELLCGAWAIIVGTVQVFQIPQPSASQSPAPTVLTVHNLNTTTATASDITRIYTEKEYMDPAKRYEGLLHPFDGWIAQNGLMMPMAYVLLATSKVPSWAFMIGLSMFSRYWVSKRTARGIPPFSRADTTTRAPAPPAPAAAVGNKKRK